MSEQKKEMSVTERKRVQNMKNLIIVLMFAAIIIPCTCCVVLFVKINVLGQSVEKLTGELGTLRTQIEEWQSVENNISDASENVANGSLSQDTSYDEASLTKEEQQSGTVQNEDIANQDIDQDSNTITENAVSSDSLRKVYLTIDDGPSAYTLEILDILDRYDVKATFFVVGRDSDTSKEALKEIVERGHSLGMHSYSHKYSEIYASLDAFAADFEKQRNYLHEVTGVWSDIYRFPGGSSNVVSDIDMQEFAAYLEEQGVTFFDWNVSSGDGGSVVLSVEQLLENCVGGAEKLKEATILLHESTDKKTTVEALPLIIEKILAMGDTVILPITEETKPVQHITAE